MVKFSVLLGTIAIVVLIWSIGAAFGLWANPVFAPFFIISANLAIVLSYVGLSVGSFLSLLSVIINYRRNKKEMDTNSKLNSRKSYEDIPERSRNGLMTKLKMLLGLLGISFLVWSIGILTGLWGNPIFSYFWIASSNLANYLSYLGLGVGAFVVALSVFIYYKNSKKEIETHFKLNSLKSSDNVFAHAENGLMVKLTVPLSLIGIGFLAWSIGISVGLWRNPIFSYFWVAGNDLANNFSYLGFGAGAILIALALIIYYKNIKTDKIFKIENRLKQRREEFHYYLSEKNQQLINDNENYPTVLMNGRRSELGEEEMEKIVN